MDGAGWVVGHVVDDDELGVVRRACLIGVVGVDIGVGGDGVSGDGAGDVVVGVACAEFGDASGADRCDTAPIECEVVVAGGGPARVGNRGGVGGGTMLIVIVRNEGGVRGGIRRIDVDVGSDREGVGFGIAVERERGRTDLVAFGKRRGVEEVVAAMERAPGIAGGGGRVDIEGDAGGV